MIANHPKDTDAFIKKSSLFNNGTKYMRKKKHYLLNVKKKTIESIQYVKTQGKNIDDRVI